MKINISYFFILICFFVYLNCNFINGSSLTEPTIYDNVFQIQELTKNKVVDSYPEQSDVETCLFKYDYLVSCINDNGFGYPSLNVPPVDASPYMVSSYSIEGLTNTTSAIYFISFRLNPSTSRVILNVSISGCGYIDLNPQFELSMQCHEVNVSSLNFHVSEVFYSFFISYYVNINITGLLYPLKMNNQLMSTIGGGIYLYTLPSGYYQGHPVDFYDTFTIGNLTMNFKIGTQDILLSVAPYQGFSIINRASDFKTYPSNLNDTKIFDQQYICSAIVTCKVKSTIYPPIVFMYNQANQDNKYLLWVMYGESDGSFTYYQTLSDLSYSDLDAYFFTQKGEHFESFSSLGLSLNPTSYYSTALQIQQLEFGNNLIFNMTLSDTGFQFLPLTFFFSGLFIPSSVSTFPFGFSSGRLNSFDYESNWLTTNQTISISCNFQNGATSSFSKTIPQTDFNQPIIKNVQVKHIMDYFVSVVIQVSDESGISKFQAADQLLGVETLVDGTIYDGTFELVLPLIISDLTNIIVSDASQNPKSTEYTLPISTYYSIDPVGFYSKPSSYDYSFIELISSVDFDSYEMDITNSDAYNTMYIDFNGTKLNYPFYILIVDKLSYADISSSFYFAKWDDIKKVYYVNFQLQKNGFPAQYLDFLIYKNPITVAMGSVLNGKTKKKCTVKSLTMDSSGPMVTNIAKLAGGIVNLNDAASSQSVGWNITIEDKINGFSNGYIIAQGLVDGSTYNFTLNSQKAEKSITFTLLLSNISCVDQAFQINRVELCDTANKKSGFDYSGYAFYNFNALMNYNNDLDILRVNVSCTPSTPDTSGPELLSIIPNKQSVDVGSNDRSIEFTLKVRDLQSGINVGQSPIVYITSDDFKQVECKSSLVICNNNDIECTFKCKTELPYAFTFSKQILYQVYGIWNKNGIFSGYSYGKLSSIGINSIINSTFSRNIPVITKTNKVTNEPNSEILIIGNAIGNATLVIINFDNGTKSSATPICDSPLYCIIQFAGTSQPFTIQIQLKDKSLSNIYRITPDIVGSFDYISSSSSSTTSPSASCPGQPVCGGPSNGICTSKGCVCVSPWFGVECKQKIIIIPQPSFNTDPNITFIVPNENNSNQIEFTSLTSIVSLREINIYNEPINTHPFSLWYNNQINSTLNEYYSNFTNINNMGKTTQVKVSVQWFSNQTNIEFAGNQLIMNPSSIKYTIEIKDYPFKSNLNSLEIVMSALFQSNQDKSCSSKEFGDSNEYEDSNYLKLQVNDHSLYARFIKRGIIDDNRTVPISNRLLDSNFTTIDQASTTQSYIGITIQHFDNIAIVDPDFSVMLDYSKSSNSICNNSSKLTSTQIAGIVIGCVGFAAVIAISFIVYHIKKRRNAREMSNLSNRLKSLS